MTDKTELRHKMAALKRQHTQQELAAMSEELMERVEEHPRFCNARTLLLYSALPDEVQTLPLIERWWKQKNILLPVVSGDDLELRLYRGPEFMTEGAFHIAEPTGHNFTDYSRIDLAIIPGVAFDAHGN